MQPDKIEDLIHFLGFLTQSMHKTMPSSEIIWYDSVTSEGELTWQNELNGKNRYALSMGRHRTCGVGGPSSMIFLIKFETFIFTNS